MIKSKLRKQSYVVIAAVLAVAVGYPVCAFFPQMRAISRVRQEIRQKQDFVAATEKLRPEVARQKTALASTRQYIARQSQRLVEPAQLSQVFREISSLSQQTGATTTRFEPHAAEQFDTFRKVPVMFGVAGSTAAIETLLAQIERLPYTIWLENLKIDSGEDGEDAKLAVELAIFVDNPENSN